MTPLILAAALAAVPPIDAAGRQAAVAEAARLLRDNYVDPAVGAAAADRLTQALAAGAYDGAGDVRAFSSLVTADLAAASHDKHLTVVSRVEAQGSPVPARTAGGFARVERLRGNVGYARLDSFPPLGLFVPFADAAMAALAGTDALILDLRENSGGAASSVIYLASVFFDPRAPVALDTLTTRTPGSATYTTLTLRSVPTPTSYLGKPLVILVGPRTFSGGEELADALQAQGRAVVVGARTAGGGNPGSAFPLAGGILRLFVPSSRAENPVTHRRWEGEGVAPDVAAGEDEAFAAALRRLGRPPGKLDALVEARLVKLRDPGRRDPGAEPMLRKLMADLAAGAPDYAAMASDIAAATRRGAASMRARLTALGPVTAVRFRGVNYLGADEYDVTYAHGAAVWMIHRMPDGKLAAFGFSPVG
jgi:hypothetical protein